MNKFNYRKEAEKLAKITSKLNATKNGKAYDRLIEDAAFQAEQLEKLQKIIALEGWTESYQNGEHQSGFKPSAAGSAYLQLAKAYRATIGQLMAAVHEAEKAAAEGQERTNSLLDLLRERYAREDRERSNASNLAAADAEETEDEA